MACTKYELHILNETSWKLCCVSLFLYLILAFDYDLILRWKRFKIQTIAYNSWSSIAVDVNQSILSK